jgi:protein SCO1
MVFFGFTNCPDICPLTMHELTGFYRDLEGSAYQQDTQVVMISVDPFRDDTAQIAQYMGAFHEDFLGVNGDFQVIHRLAREMFISHGVMPLPDADGARRQQLLDRPQRQYSADWAGRAISRISGAQHQTRNMAGLMTSSARVVEPG